MKSLLILFCVAANLFCSACETGLQTEEVYSVEAETVRLTNTAPIKAHPNWSPDGRRIAFSQSETGTRLFKLSLAGEAQLLLEDDDFYGNLKLSPDGNFVAYNSYDRGHVWVRSLTDGAVRVLTPEQRGAAAPFWSRDGQWIGFQYATNERRNSSIWIIPAAGGAARPITPQDQNHYTGTSFSPDGQKIAVSMRPANNLGQWEIATVDVNSGEVKQLTAPPFDKLYSAWSPDGATIAYVAYEDSCSSTYSSIQLIPAEGGEARELVTVRGRARWLTWSPEGDRLLAEVQALGLHVLDVTTREMKLLTLPRGLNATSTSWFPEGEFLLLPEYVPSVSIGVVALEDKQPRKISDRKIDQAYYPAWLNAEEIMFVRDKAFWKIPAAGGTSVLMALDTSGRKFDFELSPDRKQVLFDDGRDVFLQALAGGPARNLTAHIDEPITQATWSPEGKLIAATHYSGLKVFELVSEKIVERKMFPGYHREPAWSPQSAFGAYLAFVNSGSIFLATLEDSEPKQALAYANYPAWSPDGRRLAYVFVRDIYVSKVLERIE